MSENPYAAPAHQPAPQPVQAGESPYGPIRSLEGRAKFCKITLILSVVTPVIAFAYLFTSGYKDLALDIESGTEEEFAALTNQLYIIGALILGVFVATVVAVCMWSVRAMANTWAYVQLKPSISPGWAAGWYFIPIANLFKPYQAMKEIWKGSLGEQTPHGILLLWWWCWILSGLFDNISGKLDFEQYEATVLVDGASLLLTTIAAVCLIKVITRITDFYSDKSAV